VNFARNERHALAALLGEKGPDAPTLCAGWTTKDLAAHLVTREHRPDAAVGIVIRPLAAYTASVQRRIGAQHSYAELVEMIRRGPPRLSIFALPGVDAAANAVEYFVHHEDVRRGSPGWQARELGTAVDDMLWRRLGVSRFLLRSAPCGVALQREGRPGTQPIVAKRGTPTVTVTGAPAELTLWAFGRTSAALVNMDGDADAVARLGRATWGL